MRFSDDDGDPPLDVIMSVEEELSLLERAATDHADGLMMGKDRRRAYSLRDAIRRLRLRLPGMVRERAGRN